MAGSTEKALQKLQQYLLVGQSYEGQQMIKTVYHRLRSRKKLVESYQLIEEAAKLQLQDGQVRSKRSCAL